MKLLTKLINLGVITWFLVLLIWQVLSLIVGKDFVPGPYDTFLAAIELARDGTLTQYIGISFLRVLMGWSLGCLIAIPIGLLMGKIAIIRALAEPFLNFIRFIPALAFLTLFMLWFGLGEESKIALIVYATLFIVILNTFTGVLAVEDDKIRSARNMGASEWQILIHVVIPATIPYIFTGARLAMGTGYMAIIGAEMIAANQGVGFLIWNARLYFKMDWIFVGLISLGIMGFITDRALGYLGSLTLSKYGITSKRKLQS